MRVGSSLIPLSAVATIPIATKGGISANPIPWKEPPPMPTRSPEGDICAPPFSTRSFDSHAEE
jgi:hypothetical protein